MTSLILNALGYSGAYFLTHNLNPDEFGIGLPRSQIYSVPTEVGLKYTKQKIAINNNEWLSTWLIKADNPQGTVILFHGKESSKSSLLAPAKIFNDLNYNALLVDFRGAGNSSGNTSTVGFQEGEDVAVAFKYIKELNINQPIILYGISMGSASILQAIADRQVKPNGIILELPFARLLDAVRNRLGTLNLPSFILGELIVLWGGIQHGFNGFTHNPIEYVKAVNCPTLIFAGDRDPLVEVSDVKQMHNNLNVQKKLVFFPDAGHQLLVKVDPKLWQENVKNLMDSL
ncbi:alpha/beta hydrolase [Xenococcus sp. PCC 7305]|uniref:alpha/beta hydrolase n=1 Tax=Xenococcus sp. PCC 7305 TaxID=102125 RepID=UPI00031FFAD8|nr:alpha/beta fold hydrolase [Xenococcus sp. PCC 7305]